MDLLDDEPGMAGGGEQWASKSSFCIHSCFVTHMPTKLRILSDQWGQQILIGPVTPHADIAGGSRLQAPFENHPETLPGQWKNCLP